MKTWILARLMRLAMRLHSQALRQEMAKQEMRTERQELMETAALPTENLAARLRVLQRLARTENRLQRQASRRVKLADLTVSLVLRLSSHRWPRLRKTLSTIQSQLVLRSLLAFAWWHSWTLRSLLRRS